MGINLNNPQYELIEKKRVQMLEQIANPPNEELPIETLKQEVYFF